MRLRRLLKELRENMLRDKSDQIAGASDYLWTDETLVGYIDQAQKRFAHLTECIRDAQTPQVCQFKTVTDQRLYTLDKSIIGVLSVHMDGDHADLARAGHSDLSTYHMPDTYFFDPAQLANLPPGKPLAYSTDEGIGQDDDGTYSTTLLRLYPKVSADYAGITGYLRVTRLPLLDLTCDNLDLVPEIPDLWHMSMLDWAAYLALRGPDLDVAGGDAIDRSDKFAKSFQAHVDEAKAMAKKKMFTPLQWAFGRNGFSYEHY